MPAVTNPWSYMESRFPVGNLLDVASVDHDGDLSYFSDFGDDVEIAAPGGFDPTGHGLLSTTYELDDHDSIISRYWRMEGTSQAAPMVSGVAALVLQKYPHWTGRQVAACLTSSASRFVERRNDKTPDEGYDGHQFPFTGRIPIVDAATALDCASSYIDPPTDQAGSQYIARDPGTGRSVLVANGIVTNIADGGTFQCLAKTRLVWDIPNLKALAEAPIGTATCDNTSRTQWTYTPTAQGGNTGTNVILRGPERNNWLVNKDGVLQPIDNGGTYLCLANKHPVIWDTPQTSIDAWSPASNAPATCGNITVSPNMVVGRVWEPVSVQLSATGGRAPYSWAFAPYGSLGMSLSSAGLLTGTPKYSGDWTMNLLVRDATGAESPVDVVLRSDYGVLPPISGTPRRLTTGNKSSSAVGLSGDGRWALVFSEATNLTSDPACATGAGWDLLLYDTSTGVPRCVTGDLAERRWAFLSRDGSRVLFERADGDVRVWDRGTGATTAAAVPAASADPCAMSPDAGKVAWRVFDPATSRLDYIGVQDVASGVFTPVASTDLDFQSCGTFTLDGSLFAFTARQPGPDVVHHIYVFNAGTGSSIEYRAQTATEPAISGDGSFVTFNRYQYLYNGDLGILKLPYGNYYYTVTGDEVGIRWVAVPGVGHCAVGRSYEPDSLTDDLPNRGLQIAYDDLFVYNVDNDSYFRVTNTYRDGVSGGYSVSDDCHGVLFGAPPNAMSKTATETEPTDVYFTDLSDVLPN